MQRNTIYYINQLRKERKSYQVSNDSGSDSFSLLSSSPAISTSWATLVFLCSTRVGDEFLSAFTFQAETPSTDMLSDITGNRLRKWIFMMATKYYGSIFLTRYFLQMLLSSIFIWFGKMVLSCTLAIFMWTCWCCTIIWARTMETLVFTRMNL